MLIATESVSSCAWATAEVAVIRAAATMSRTATDERTGIGAPQRA
jgi:hypothetical protein